MAKQVIWSQRAQADRKEILAYWRKRNKSNTYSLKLNALFKEAVALISDHPGIGKETDKENVQAKIVRDYLLIYQETDLRIEILVLWDSQQDPEKLSKIIE